MNKITLILVLVIALIVGSWWWMTREPKEVAPVVEAPAVEPAPAPDPDSSAELQKELQALDVGDVGADLQEVDAGISQL